MARSRVPARRGAPAARVLPLLPLIAGAGLLAAAEPMTLRSVRMGSRTAESLSAGAHHGWALAVVAAALVLLGLLGVVRDARAAAVGAVALAVIALWIVLAVDRPALDAAGLVDGRLAQAHAGPAFRVELVGAVLALVGALGGLAERRG